MPEIIYEIKTTTIKDFTYRKPLVYIDDNGEPQCCFSEDKETHVHIKKVIFLNMIGYQKVVVGKDNGGNPIAKKGKLISYEPLDYANQYILSKHIEDDKEESLQSSKALTHYFSFILDVQSVWDRKFNNDDYDPLTDPPRPFWDKFSIRKNLRTTYMYHASVKSRAIEGTGLARTTASAYMREVVGFYKYHIRKGMKFNNPPFEFEIFSIDIENSGTHMKTRRLKQVQSTDLKLNFTKSQRNNGGSLPNARRDLKSLTNAEWKEAKKILTTTKRVIKNVKREEKWVSLPQEFCLLFRIYRYTGLRKEEGASLHLGQVIRPDMTKTMLRLGVGDQYGSLAKDPKGGYHNKSRRTIITSSLMSELYSYSQSPRYQKRLEKFKKKCKAERDAGNTAYFDGVDGVDENKKYLFISNSGIPFFKKLEEINTRWNEVRKTAGRNLLNDIDAVVHNLRSTFAVSIFRMLLKKMTSDKALSIVSEFLGHEDIATTLLYLQIAEDQPTGDEIWEDIMDYLGVFQEMIEDGELDNNAGFEQKDFEVPST
ncbi:tyrosine-type recombinase/integrase [Vibrio cyclitrophicus]|uniref:tyrosine-type recombinase/integrase n=1 Tax=Vibrio cyclitrophicus TaxID=47951 RepID=UPI0002E5D500|nr:tyrosine-type recombinase/integrase [Vibrio cyclitrophicus]OEE16432.1 integrase [Vibrio cyclitrophicus ZF207]